MGPLLIGNEMSCSLKNCKKRKDYALVKANLELWKAKNKSVQRPYGIQVPDYVSYADEDAKLMEVLLALVTLKDDEVDESDTNVEDEDTAVDSFHNNVHWKEGDAIVYPTTAATANDHAREVIDDIFPVATIVATKPISLEVVKSTARTDRETSTRRKTRKK